MKKFIILTILFISACSSNSSRILLLPQAENNQTITYARGGMKLHAQSAQSVLKPEVIILDYSHNEMVIGLSVTNTTLEPILFSEKNIAVNLLTSEQSQAAVVYTYDQLLSEATDTSASTVGQVGQTAAGVGVGFIPYGGIAYSFGRLFYSIGSQNTGVHQKRIDKLTFSQLNQNYLRQQTIEAGDHYSGILKVGFENEWQAGDTIIIQVSAGDEIEKFKFACDKHQKN